MRAMRRGVHRLTWSRIHSIPRAHTTGWRAEAIGVCLAIVEVTNVELRSATVVSIVFSLFSESPR
jgi:hypothetical protein